MISERYNHKRKSLIVSALVLGFLLGLAKVNATAYAQKYDRVQYRAGERNKYVVLKYLVPALNQAGKAGRLYYTADCPPYDVNFYDPYPFPAINVQPPSKDVSGLAAIREIFRGDANVEVEEKPPGIVRIRIGKVFDDILQTHISHITLLPTERYNPLFAILAIRDSAEVQAASKQLGIRYDGRPFDYLFQTPDEGLPHISGPLKNLTMEQALDVVAQTFGDIVVYSTCTKQHHIGLEATGGPDFDVTGLLQ